VGVGRRTRTVLAAVIGASALGVVPVEAESGGPEVSIPYEASIFLIPARGGPAQAVTPPGELAFDPEWRPRTRSLVVVTEQGVLELRARRGSPSWDARRVLYDRPAWSPSFSPDGSKLAFVTGTRSDVWTLTMKTGRLRRLTGWWYGDGFIDWAPSGKELAVTKQGALLRMNLDGEVIESIVADIGTCFSPAWAPAGGRFAFACMTPDLSVHVGNPRRRSFSSLTRGEPPSAYPAWSPDGRSLAYAKFVDGSWDLFVRDVARKTERRLTATPYDEVDPAWSPDGSLLAYTSNA
jgi:dipeptidyl aminopeptidase/acylaminoacyl peptidase